MTARTLEEILNIIEQVNIQSIVSLADNPHMYAEEDGVITIYNSITIGAIRAVVDLYDPNKETFPSCGAMPYLDYMVISKHDFNNLIDFCLCLRL